MKKRIVAVGLTLLALSLSGCSGDNSSQAMDLCVKAAEAQVGASLDTGELESANMGDALFEAGIKDDRETDDSDALFIVSGEVTYEKDGTETRKSMVCSVTFEDGQAGEPEMNLT